MGDPGLDDAEGVTSQEKKSRGRTRFCKTCKFSSTDAKEFQHHQMYAHNAEENKALDKEIQAQKLEPRRKSLNAASRSPRRSKDDSENHSKTVSDQKQQPEQNRQFNATDDDTEQMKLSNMDDSLTKKSPAVPVKRTGNIQTRNYVCSKCTFDTTSAQVFLHHQVDEHQENISIFECDLCDYATKYKQKLPRHRKLHFTAREGGDTPDMDFATVSAISEGDLADDANDSSDVVDGVVNNLSSKPSASSEIIELGFEDLDSDKPEDIDTTEVAPSEMEEEGAEPEMEIDTVETPAPVITSTPTTASASPSDTPVRKKAPRQEVDPRKYVVIRSDKGVKFACSRCTSIYSWRKSLNKHWKEKHPGDLPDAKVKAKKLAELSESEAYGSQADVSATLVRGKHNFTSFGPPMTSSPVLNIPRSRSSTPLSGTGLPTNGSAYHQTSYQTPDGYPAHPMPNVIGPFVTNSIRPTYVNESGTAEEPKDIMARMHPEILDLSTSAKQEYEDDSSLMDESLQNEPLDFSIKQTPLGHGASSVRTLLENGSLEGQYLYNKMRIKPEPVWSGDENENFKKDNFNVQKSAERSPSKSNRNHVLQCSRCAYVAKTLVDYSAHMGIHLNKKAFKCAECQEHFSAVEELNTHFAEQHSEKILKHKEAIQKIPHGLLQTYHLLNVPVNKLSTLSNNSYTQTGDKQLKCNMCGFVARWPAELQKHAVSHSEERPFVCMVCGSTYKWKWDLVKHFEKSHHTLPNPYKRRDPGSQQSPSSSLSTSTAAALLDNDRSLPVTEEDSANSDTEQSKKRRRLSDSDLSQLKARNNESDNTEHNSDINNSEYEPTDDCKILSQEYENEYLAALEMRRLTPAEIEEMKQLRMTNEDMEGIEFDPEDPEPYMQYCRPIHEETQKIIAETLKQRISQGKFPNSKDDLSASSVDGQSSSADILLPYKCPSCEYRARWPSEITQHMKNHSDEKPFRCPRCSYRSKWKWDVVKHLKRCGGGTIKDVIDTSQEEQQMDPTGGNIVLSIPKLDGTKQSTTPPLTYLVGSFPNSQNPNQGVSLLPSQRSVLKPPCPNVTVLPPNASGMVGIPSAGMLQNSSDGPLSPNPAHGGANQKGVKQPVFHGLINGGMYHCLHCPFVGHSPAELKRHSMIHSEERPFTCSTCGYSSKWKGDLKKHLRTYNHAGIIPGPPTNRPILPRPEPSDEESPTNLSQSDDHQGNDGLSMIFHDKLLFKCKSCPYVTYKKHSYDAHLKIHGTSSSSEGPSKFKCKQCQFQAQDLSTFLQHRVTHTQAAQMTVPTKKPVAHQSTDNEVSSRTLHLKYRRKPVKQFKCTKCPYVCFKRSGLDSHEAMHEPRGVDAYTCLFCDYNVYNRSLLMQHMRLHSEFDPAIHAEMIGDAEHDAISDIQDYADGNDDVIDLTPNTNYVYSMDVQEDVSPIQEPIKQVTSNKRQLACEWCSASFDHLLNLFQHAQMMHPRELSAQEKKPMDFSQTTVPSHPIDFSQKHKQHPGPYPRAKPGVSLLTGTVRNSFMGNQQFATPKSYQPIMPKKPDSSPTQNDMSKQAWLLNARKTTRSPVAARKSTSPAKRSPRHQCSKCPFIASNLFSYYRHMERHGSNCKHTCPYCDYSINRLNLLYQHMKGAHNIYWYSGDGKNSGPDLKQVALADKNQIASGDLSRTSTPTNVSPSPTGSSYSQDMDAPPTSVSPSSSFGQDLIEEMGTDISLERAGMNIDFKKRLPVGSIRKPGSKPTLVIVEETNWRGIPIQICFLDGRKNYKCPLCNYISNNAANATNHVRQHGTNRRYRCDYCNYSVDNLRLVYHHMESIHRNCPYNTVERFDKSGEHLESMDESLLNDDASSVGTAEDIANNVLDNKVISQLETALSQTSTVKSPKDEPPRRSIKCSFCPFRAKNKDSYTKHLEMHEVNGRYKCKHCSYSADRLNLMTQHSRVHIAEGAEIGNCTEMSPGFGALPKHSTINMNSRVNGRIRYRCSRCPFKTFCKSNIIKHRRQHLMNGKYKCQKCNYSAMRWYVLQQHLKFHEAEDPTKSSTNKDSFQDYVLDPNDEKAAEALRQAEPGTLPDSEQNANSVDYGGEPMDFDAEQDMENLENSEIDDMQADDAFRYENETNVPESMECRECPYTAFNVIDYRKHSRLHKLSLKFRCDMCSYSIDRLNLVLAHHKIHSEDPNYIEDVSADSFINPDYVEKGRPASSPNTDSGDSGVEKLMVKSGSMSEESKRFTCSMCPYQCNKVKNLNAHMARHGQNGKFICDCCSWSSNRLNLVYQHRRVHSKEPDFDQNPEDIKFLNREYVISESVSPSLEYSEDSAGETGQDEEVTDDQAHIELVRDKSLASGADSVQNLRIQRLYNCRLCPFSCNSKSSFAYHKNLHHIRARYTCTHCTYSVARWNLLRQHMRLHEEPKEDVQNQKRLRCPMCPYHTRSKDLLDAHITMHSAGKKYSCDFCNFSSEQYSQLQQHLKVHSTITIEAKDSPDLKNSELKVFEPPEAGKSRSLLYFRGNKSTNEDTADTPEAELKCDRCPFSTPTKEEMAVHDDRHNVKSDSDCPFCDFSCPRLEELLEHARLHFPSTQMDMSTLQNLLSKNEKKKSEAVAKLSQSTADMETEDSETPADDDKKAKETTSDEKQISADGENSAKQEEKEPAKSQRTKVYVCQYCDREFEDKILMRDHEKQHLIGSQY